MSSKMPSAVAYSQTSPNGDLGVVTAIGLSGSSIYNPLDSSNRDAVVNEAGGFDVCLSHTMA